MRFNPLKILRYVARLGRPLLAIVGIKPKTLAGKIAEAAETIDSAVKEIEERKEPPRP